MVVELSADMRQIGLELKLVDKRFAAAMKRELRAVVTELGFAHVERAKSAATSQGLHKAAEAVYARASFAYNTAGVRIIVNRGKAPYAPIYELGNKDDGTPDEGTFTNGTKGVIKKRPFFYHTMENMEAADEAAFVTAMDIVCREAGFR